MVKNFLVNYTVSLSLLSSDVYCNAWNLNLLCFKAIFMGLLVFELNSIFWQSLVLGIYSFICQVTSTRKQGRDLSSRQAIICCCLTPPKIEESQVNLPACSTNFPLRLDEGIEPKSTIYEADALIIRPRAGFCLLSFKSMFYFHGSKLYLLQTSREKLGSKAVNRRVIWLAVIRLINRQEILIFSCQVTKIPTGSITSCYLIQQSKLTILTLVDLRFVVQQWNIQIVMVMKLGHDNMSHDWLRCYVMKSRWEKIINKT